MREAAKASGLRSSICTFATVAQSITLLNPPRRHPRFTNSSNAYETLPPNLIIDNGSCDSPRLPSQPRGSATAQYGPADALSQHLSGQFAVGAASRVRYSLSVWQWSRKRRQPGRHWTSWSWVSFKRIRQPPVSGSKAVSEAGWYEDMSKELT